MTNYIDGERREVDKNDGVLLLCDGDSADAEEKLSTVVDLLLATKV